MDSLTRKSVEDTKAFVAMQRQRDFWRCVAILALGALAVAFAGRISGGAELAASPADAVRIARTDAKLRGESSLDCVYFFNLYGDDPEEFGAFSYSLNTVISTNSTPQLLCFPVDKAGYVLRVNLRLSCPRDKDYIRVRLLHESLAHRNFYFHSINPFFKADKDGIALSTVAAEHKIIREVPPFKFNGKTFTRKAFAHFVPGVFLAGLKDADLAAYDELCELTGSDNPIMRMDQYVAISHRAAGDGLYYELAGLPETEAEFDRLAGVDFKRSGELRSDQRTVMWRRQLNDQPTMVEWAASLGVKPTYGMIPAFATLDYTRRGSAADIHPLYNILDKTHVATEKFAPKPNAHIWMWLANAKGERQDVAPGNIALDSSVSPPVEVEAGLCFRCHSEWFKPLTNDLLAMVDVNVPIADWDKLPLQQKFRKLGIIDDLGQKSDLEDILDRAAGLYEGNPNHAIALANLTHAKAVIVSTGGIFGLDPVPKASAKLASIFNRYERDPITPQTACLELGIRTKDDIEAQKILRDVSLQLHPNTLGFSPETPALWALIAWKPGSRALPKRQDWETEYAVLMARVNNALRAGELKL